MTVTYSAEVATSSCACFLKLLIRWRGSVYKLVWREFFVFCVAYFGLSFLYRFVIDGKTKIVFEQIVLYCNKSNELIPVAFVLGFYVSIVVTRWWDQFLWIPWPDQLAMNVVGHVHGTDDRGRMMRRTIMRYCNLSFVLTMSSISTSVKKRFPTFQHITDAGIMLPNEQKILEDLHTQHNKYFVPVVWATILVSRARKEGRVKDDFAVQTLINCINDFRTSLGQLFSYDWISVPLVYTQVVTIATYTFLISCIMGRQFIKPADVKDHVPDAIVPIFTILQFFFYMGWLKVAETLVNPFGEDDDDFDINHLIDRNMQISYLIVDEMHFEQPELLRDQYWDEVEFELPYTAAAEHFRNIEPFLGSANQVEVLPEDSEFIPLTSILEASENLESLSGSIQWNSRKSLASFPKNIMQMFSGQKSAISTSHSSRLSHHSVLSKRRSNTSRDSQYGHRSNSAISSTTKIGSPDSKRSIITIGEDNEDIFSMSDLEVKVHGPESNVDRDGLNANSKMADKLSHQSLTEISSNIRSNSPSPKSGLSPKVKRMAKVTLDTRKHSPSSSGTIIARMSPQSGSPEKGIMKSIKDYFRPDSPGKEKSSKLLKDAQIQTSSKELIKRPSSRSPSLREFKKRSSKESISSKKDLKTKSKELQVPKFSKKPSVKELIFTPREVEKSPKVVRPRSKTPSPSASARDILVVTPTKLKGRAKTLKKRLGLLGIDPDSDLNISVLSVPSDKSNNN